jgi:hypothetical protein
MMAPAVNALHAGEQINQLESQEGPEQSPIQRFIDEDSRRKRKLGTRDEPAGEAGREEKREAQRYTARGTVSM